MKRICPNPMPWHEAVERLTKYASLHACTPPSPPVPLILAGWVYGNDLEKMNRWGETVVWADSNGCADLVSNIPEQDFYCVDCPTTYAVGPRGGPMIRPRDSQTKSRPASEELAKHMDILISRWPEIVGQELTSITRPVAFTGAKARRLLVLADAAAVPPWGSWASLSTQEPERRTFTDFRSAINAAIAPHQVDHIDFTTELSGTK
jgi:hypothetical protein